MLVVEVRERPLFMAGRGLGDLAKTYHFSRDPLFNFELFKDPCKKP